MTYKPEPVFPLPEGYFPAFYKQLFLADAPIAEIYPNVGFEPNWKDLFAQRSAFPIAHRQILVETLRNQYGDSGHQLVHNQIESLLDSNTFTITTGQQIHIFLGPLYVIYKSLSTIHYAQKVQRLFPEKKIVPVFWMATEDHDKAEIDHITAFGKNFKWDTEQTGAVGKFNTHGLGLLVDELKSLANGDADFLNKLEVFEQAYTRFSNFADATRFLLDHFFGHQGLVVVDADAPALKATFKSVMRKDLLEDSIGKAMEVGVQKLYAANLEPSLQAKDGNFFLLSEGARKRLDRGQGVYKIQGTSDQITEQELEKTIENTPEKLSPNVALRPVYQETVLPNLAYIAGPGEIKYWLQLPPVFAACGVPLPALIPRHSVIITDSKFENWIPKSGLTISEMWGPESNLKNTLKLQLTGQKTAESEISQLTVILEDINKKLYEQRNPELKELKRKGEEFLKALKKAENQFANDTFSVPENQARLDKALKFHHSLFDIEAPQERVVDFIQMWLASQVFDTQVLSLSDISVTNLFTYRYDLLKKI